MDIFHGGDIMKVGEARGIYSSVLKSYNQQKFKLSKQRNELKERMESTPDGKTLYADEAATLDLQYNAVAEKQDEYQDYVDQNHRFELRIRYRVHYLSACIFL